MKINLSKMQSGEVTATPQNEEDLWVLSQIIDSGNRVRAPTFRKIKIGDGKTDRNVKIVRKPVTLTLLTEKTEFTGEHLRVLGTIVQGPDDVSMGEHHSFSIEPNTTVRIFKEYWPSYLVDKLKRALRGPSAKILICAFDRDDATFAVTSSTGYDVLGTIHSNLPKKADVKQVTSDFFKEIADTIKDYVARYGVKTILVASPAFWKQYLVEKLNLESVKVISGVINTTGERGIAEAFKRPEMKHALSESHIVAELALVDELLSAIATDKPVAYGIKDCKRASSSGAINCLLVSEKYVATLRQNNTTKQLEELLKTTEQGGASIHFIGLHDGGKKIDGLGGVAALLRFPLV